MSGADLPTVTDALRQAVQLHAAGDLAAAAALYRQILGANPDEPNALHLLGMVDKQNGQLASALSRIAQGLKIDPNLFGAQENLQNTLSLALNAVIRSLDADQPDAAATLFTAIIAAPIDHADVAAGMDFVRSRIDAAALSYLQNKRYREALALLRALQPDDRACSPPEIMRAAGDLLRIGFARITAGNVETGLNDFRHAAALDPSNPVVWREMGMNLRNLGRYADAVAAFRQAVKLFRLPEDMHAHSEVHYFLGQSLMALGRVREGRAECEWRLKTQPYHAWPRLAGREWTGDIVPGQRILLDTEGGFGDAIRYVRYVKTIQRLGMVAILRCPDPLTALLSTVGPDELAPHGRLPPGFDVRAKLWSVPHLIGEDPNDPSPQVAYLHAVPDRVRQWGQRLNEDCRAVRRVGVAWQARYGGAADRCIQPTDLQPLTSIEGVVFYSLHKPDTAGIDDGALAALGIRSLGADFDTGPDALLDTAAVMMNMDLIITVDTVFGHLAAALGRPVWAMLPFVCDGIWTATGNRTPWYPSIRLFRQRRPDDWTHLIADVAASLTAGHDGPLQPPMTTTAV